MEWPVNLKWMNQGQVHPENSPPPPTVTSSSRKECMCVFALISIPTLLVGAYIYVNVIANTIEPYATFQVESLVLVSHQEQWNITVRVGYPEPDRSNKSFEIANVYLSLDDQTIAIGQLLKFEGDKKETIVKGSLNAMLLPEMDIHILIKHYRLLVLNIGFTVKENNAKQGQGPIHHTLGVVCEGFSVSRSSTVWEIQLKTKDCTFEMYPVWYH